MNRRFKLNTHLTLPLDLLAGPGGLHARYEPGDVIELDPERCRVHDRFIRGRIRAGDMTELNEPSPVPARPAKPSKE